MKKGLKSVFIAAICLTGIALSQSCNKLPIGKDVSWTGADVTITVPIVPDTLSHSNVGGGSFKYNLDSMIKAQTGSNTLGVSNISKVTLNSCQLTILNPDQSNNFANFESCYLNVSTSNNSTPVEAASITNNPDQYAETLSLPVSNNIDLKSYLSSGNNTVTVSYSLGGKLRRATNKMVNINIHASYTIHVGN
jgi:hypothetical protein